MNSILRIEEEIRKFVENIPGGEIEEEILVEFLLKLPQATGEVPMGVCYNGGEVGIIKVEYSGNPCDGIRKWCTPVGVDSLGSGPDYV